MQKAMEEQRNKFKKDLQTNSVNRIEHEEMPRTNQFVFAHKHSLAFSSCCDERCALH